MFTSVAFIASLAATVSAGFTITYPGSLTGTYWLQNTTTNQIQWTTDGTGNQGLFSIYIYSNAANNVRASLLSSSSIVQKI